MPQEFLGCLNLPGRPPDAPNQCRRNAKDANHVGVRTPQQLRTSFERGPVLNHAAIENQTNLFGRGGGTP